MSWLIASPSLAADSLTRTTRERSLRLLAAEALAAVTPLDPEWVSAEALPRLLADTLHPDLATRHGAAAGAAAVLPALRACGAWPLPAATAAAVAGAVPAMEHHKLFRGKGGEILRSAACALLAATADAGVPLADAEAAPLLASLIDALKSPVDEVQAAAAAALGPFARAYLSPEGGGAAATTRALCAVLRTELVPASRRGAALGLGALPRALLEGDWREAVGALVAASQPEAAPEAREGGREAPSNPMHHALPQP